MKYHAIRIGIKRNKRKKAQALILTFMAIVFLAGLSAPLLRTILGERRLIERQRMEKEVFYLAEGGLEDTIKRFTRAIANFEILPDVERFPESGVSVTSYSVSGAFPKGAQAESVITEVTSMKPITDSDGIILNTKTYIVNSQAQHPDSAGITANLSQVFSLRIIYTFQHAVFYVDDLEILPGPNMNFTGRIHANKDIYIGTHATLTIDSEYLRSAGNIYNRRKDDNQSLGGRVRIRRAGTGSYHDMDGLDSDDPDWLISSQGRWHGTVKSSVHGVTNFSAPEIDSISPDGFYANNAGIKVEEGIIKRGNDVLIEGVDIPEGTVKTETNFYNNREGIYVRMASIDLKKMAGYAPGDSPGSPSFPNNLPANGLLYAAGDQTGNEQPGVKLVNGEEIRRPGGLTVVSNAPVYIEGDYNTVDKQPSAVISDAVNVLSNNWDDGNSSKALSDRIASNTEINAAFISGVGETSSGSYAGGLENYPRMHENWSGRTLSIRGSFVQLWESEIARGDWRYGSPQYTAPTRNWDYDTDFSDPNNMPPFAPQAIEAQRGAWWKN